MEGLLCVSVSSSGNAEGVPYDGVAVNEEVLAVHLSLTVILIFLSCAGILFSIVCLLFNFFFRNTKYI